VRRVVVSASTAVVVVVVVDDSHGCSRVDLGVWESKEDNGLIVLANVPEKALNQTWSARFFSFVTLNQLSD
jgi:hypothetical protein